jgi:hypothetical protein
MYREARLTHAQKHLEISWASGRQSAFVPPRAGRRGRKARACFDARRCAILEHKIDDGLRKKSRRSSLVTGEARFRGRGPDASRRGIPSLQMIVGLVFKVFDGVSAQGSRL